MGSQGAWDRGVSPWNQEAGGLLGEEKAAEQTARPDGMKVDEAGGLSLS